MWQRAELAPRTPCWAFRSAPRRLLEQLPLGNRRRPEGGHLQRSFQRRRKVLRHCRHSWRWGRQRQSGIRRRDRPDGRLSHQLHWSFRAGYELLWLDGVASVTNQVAAADPFTGAATLSQGSRVLPGRHPGSGIPPLTSTRARDAATPMPLAAGYAGPTCCAMKFRQTVSHFGGGCSPRSRSASGARRRPPGSCAAAATRFSPAAISSARASSIWWRWTAEDDRLCRGQDAAVAGGRPSGRGRGRAEAAAVDPAGGELLETPPPAGISRPLRRDRGHVARRQVVSHDRARRERV